MKIHVLPTRRYRRRAVDLTIVPTRPKKQFKIASFALGGRQLNWLAETRNALELNGISKSAIVRAAIDSLAERFAHGTADDLARYVEHCDRDVTGPLSPEEPRQ